MYLAQENWEEAVRDFKQAFELAPAGSVDERGLKGEVGDAEGKLKRSRMKVGFFFFLFGVGERGRGGGEVSCSFILVGGGE